MASFDVKTAIAQGLKAIREETGESQTSVAKALGTSRVTVNRWENGWQTPNAVQLYTTAHYYGVTADAVVNVGANTLDAKTAIRQAQEAITKED